MAADKSKVLIFASERVLNIARQHDKINIQSDGTFKTLPRMSDGYQIFIISMEIKRSVYPMIIALMERKTTAAYTTVFSHLKQLLNGTVVEKYMSDYETAIQNAVRTVFGALVIIKGCFFHFSKAVSNYADELGLYGMANESNTILCALKYATSLALLPHELIAAGINVVEKKLPNSRQSKTFVRYLRRQWCNKPEVSVFNDKVRTNNAAESLHHNFLKIVGKTRPDIYDFLIALQRFENKIYMDLYRTFNNISIPKARRKTYQLIDGIIAKAEKELKENMDVEIFLSTTSNRVNRKYFTSFTLYKNFNYSEKLLIYFCVKNIK